VFSNACCQVVRSIFCDLELFCMVRPSEESVSSRLVCLNLMYTYENYVNYFANVSLKHSVPNKLEIR
jgi:hypothetical protein